MNQSRSLTSVLGFIIFAGLILGLVWGNYNFTKKDIGGGGFFVQWIGLRSLVTDGNSPYGDIVSSQILESAKIESNFSSVNSLRYTAPLFSGVVVFPFALIKNSTLAHAFWLAAQLVAIFLILLIGLKLTAWKPRWYIFLFFSLLTILSYHVMLPWLNGGMSIWVSFFLVLAILAICNNWYEIGGVLLAFASIEPQMIILVLVLILLWAGTHRKMLLIFWFFITLIFLSIIGLFLVPDWITQYIRIMYNFTANFPPGSLGMLFKDLWPGLGKQLGWLISGVLVVILIIEWWLTMRKDFRHFFWTVCLTLVISQWIGIPTIPGHLTGLLLPLILVAAMLTERWPRGGQWVAVSIGVVLFAWEWALFFMNISSTDPGNQMNLIVPLPLVILISLYWVRWWVIKPKRLLIEEMRLGETY